VRALMMVALVPFLGIGTGARAQSDTAAGKADSALVADKPQVERAPATQGAKSRDFGALADVLDKVRENPMVPKLPSADAITKGDLTIESGRTVPGPVVVYGGNLTVLGRVDGDAIALGGDVVVASGGQVTGNAVAVEGNVKRDGTVDGEVRALSGVLTDDAVEPIVDVEPRSPASDVKLAVSWLCVLLVIGVGILVFAQPYLEGVVDTLETRFWRSFAVGVAGALAAIPVLVLMLVALGITIIGILLIPFAVVAYVLALAGLLTLGFVAIARLTGGALGSDAVRRLSARGSALRGVIIGMLVLLGMWIVAAALSGLPVVGPLLRAVAVTVTFVAATAGLGATILSRAGTRSVEATAAKPVEPAVWQTPTPVTGVAAARRPPSARKHEPV
jgi:hypothetical protein